MQTTTAGPRTTGMWAVLDGNGRVVVVFGGGEAEAEARRWHARGYRIARLAED
jgi:hypothetical protein